MKLLTTTYRNENVILEGKTFLREAVRGIIFCTLTPSPSPLRRGELLMIYSPVNRDYKFPGGGVDAGESHHEALSREINEECGATLIRVTGELGKVLEYAIDLKEDYKTFKMTSYYYFCEINGDLGAQNLDDV